MSSLTQEQRHRLFQPKFQINHTYILPDHWGQYLQSYKDRYGELINVCVNNRLERNYNVHRHAYSEIEYCTSKDELGMSKKNPDWLMITFYAIVLTLIVLMVGANVVDWLGHDQVKEHIVVSSFSVRRNWNRLTEQPTSELYREFGYIDGLRVFTSVFVLGIHCLMIAGIIPLSNPEYTEEVLKNPFLVDLCTICIVTVQIFFAISGVLLTTTVLKDIDRKPQLESIYFWEKIKNRLIRIVPVYYFFLLISIVGDELPGVEMGTVGYKTLIQEQGRCRKKWWTNVLFVSNLPPFGEERCSLQGWYLAADQQLFLVTLLLMAAFWKFPKQAGALMWTCVAIALAIPAGIVYFYELESSLPIRLSDLQFLFMYQAWFNHLYMPGYSNMNSYMAGVVVGYLYHQHKHNKLNLDNSMLYTILEKARLPLLALAYLPTFIFYRYEIPRSSWLTMTHTILYRNVGVIAGCVSFIECFRNPPGPVRQFLTSKSMTSLGKLSYSVYVLHVPVTRLVLNWFPQMIELKLLDLVWMLAVLGGSSYLVGVIVYFCIEQPVSLVLKHFLPDKRKGKAEC
ncbi:hypothetical protein pipiens_008970 [Culex pipiens pipiens]|uniref:Acyltransferase 3 domain-containing protein n=1 Tax=Culex pipiens pipiens TaxID=38569 RepID=A0ABD1DG85_CULPP